ncbi:ImmA/IrrE family metallo-endopeptidase [Streptosporangium sp. H16]|uniref:ImmA/IrrE family metallo-endopeptidase n=1 Tax=Streptosporangium sp. H16 TaxID=3444184 RepID=UPI003F7AD90F
MEATRLIQQHNVPLNQPVDVFMLAQRLGLWLSAQPLDSAAGFYLRQGAVAGAVVNSLHPENLQRYTCAHEIGHHVLGHQSHADNEDLLGKYSNIPIPELEAQVFAASLLMPLPLVNGTLRKLFGTAKPATINAAQLYLFSRDIGVSYAAAAWQLSQRKVIGVNHARALIESGAAAAKTELRGMRWVEDARADVWLFDEGSNGLTAACRVGDELHFRLSENLSTGRAWALTEPTMDRFAAMREQEDMFAWDGDATLEIADNPPFASSPTQSEGAGLDLAYDAHVGSSGAREIYVSEVPDLNIFPTTSVAVEQDSHALAQPGRREIVLVARKAGTYNVRLDLKPAWASTGQVEATIYIEIAVTERKRLQRAGLASPQKEIRVERLAAA